MRRPRKPVPPNTVTVRLFVATMTQIRQFTSEVLTACVEGPSLGCAKQDSHSERNVLAVRSQ